MLVLMLAEGVFVRRGLAGAGLKKAHWCVMGREQHAALYDARVEVQLLNRNGSQIAHTAEDVLAAGTDGCHHISSLAMARHARCPVSVGKGRL
mmetsp:Transcript_22569/g.52316  ORF Transcript_22569/g.52316 Transcript_22569/m.52316 type:complete len:93 (+) Transcript_22569:1505-1783(+)